LFRAAKREEGPHGIRKRIVMNTVRSVRQGGNDRGPRINRRARWADLDGARANRVE